MNSIRFHNQYLGIMLFLDKCQPPGGFFADNHPLWLIHQIKYPFSHSSWTDRDTTPG